MRRQQAGEKPEAPCHVRARGGQGVRREMESEGHASKLRAVAEARARANRSAMSALIRACSLEAKEIPAERARTHGVCGRHGGTEKRLTWGDLVAFPSKVFMPPGRGRRAGGIEGAIRQAPKCPVEAQREVRDRIVVTTRRESGATRAQRVRDCAEHESAPCRCEGGPQEWERGGVGPLSTALEAR
jgi:hypothetical protein